ncbi:MAG: hypothetical protein AB9873_17770 [Syntrophobacteraceae bacterium]
MKPDGDENIENDPITIVSPQSGTGDFCKEIQVEVLELGLYRRAEYMVPHLPEDLRDYYVVFRITPKSLSFPLEDHFLCHLPERAIRPIVIDYLPRLRPWLEKQFQSSGAALRECSAPHESSREPQGS